MATPENKPNGTGSGTAGERPVPPSGAGATPAPSVTPPATPAPSAYDFLTRIGLTEEEKRVLRRLLKEWARGDEDSFPFQLALLTRSQWRAAASVPGELARILENYRNTAQDAAGRIAQTAEAKLADFAAARADVAKTTAELKTQVGQLDAVARAGETRLKELTKEFEQTLATARMHFGVELAERKKQVWVWAGAINAAVVLALGAGIYYWQRHARETWQAGEIARLEEWHAGKRAEFDQKNAQNAVEWKAWAEGQVNKRVQQLEPAAYRLAQQIEKTSRPVRMSDGQAAREVRLLEEAGIINVEVVNDPETYQRIFRVYLRTDPNRLTVTAPAAAEGGGRGENKR